MDATGPDGGLAVASFDLETLEKARRALSPSATCAPTVYATVAPMTAQERDDGSAHTQLPVIRLLMPKAHFSLRRPDDSSRRCTSPSRTIEQALAAGGARCPVTRTRATTRTASCSRRDRHYAESFPVPLHEGVAVEAVETDGDGFVVRTSHGTLTADHERRPRRRRRHEATHEDGIGR